MYEELIKQLRDNAEFLVKASSGCLSNSFAETMSQAADAIEELQKRVPKTPHGRLIDADALKDLYHYNTHDSDIDKAWTGNIRRSIDSAHTIIEAEEDE